MSETQSPETIQQSALEADFTLYEQQLERLQADTVNSGGTGEWPEWTENMMFISQLNQRIKDENVEDPEQIGRLFQIIEKEADIRSHISGQKRYGVGINNLIFNLGEDIVGSALSKEEEGGLLHEAVINELQRSIEENDGLVSLLETLKVANGLSSVTELLGVSGSAYTDSIRTLLQCERGINNIRFIDNKLDSELSSAETLEKNKKWISDMLSTVAGIDKVAAENYAFSVSVRSENISILKVIKAFEHFGADRIQTISEATGIYGLESYTIEQLERMERFATSPETVANELKDHDVNVVFTNRVGDHNGVLIETADTFDDGDRTLFFEINKMDDIYRRFSKIKGAGIKPSTLVISAHGGRDGGMIYIADGRDIENKRYDVASVGARRFISAYNESSEAVDENIKAFSMHGMRGMAKLVDEYMQPSKGIEDPDTGRRKIILSSCYSGVDAKVNDKNELDETVQTGTESIISQLGKDLVDSGFDGELDIYGAPDGIQMKRRGASVVYTGSEIEYGTGRSKLHAEVVRLEKGKLTQSQVDEIKLYKQ